MDDGDLTLKRFDLAGNLVSTHSIAVLGADPAGLAFDGRRFWISENQTRNIYEIGLSPIFTDGFESGDTTAWSETD